MNSNYSCSLLFQEICVLKAQVTTKVFACRFERSLNSLKFMIFAASQEPLAAKMALDPLFTVHKSGMSEMLNRSLTRSNHLIL